MARVLVTGGAGFIGSNLVRALLERGDEVRVLDNFSTGNRANLDGLDVEIVEGELRSYERVHNAVRGVEVVYHLGALGSVPRSVQDPLTSSAVNVEGTLNVLLAARDEGIRRVVFSSSTSVYGSSRQLPTTEEHAARPDLAVRRREARGRALLRQLLARLRVVRVGRAALLQRLRPAAEPVLAVRRGRAALRHGDRGRRADRRSTATASSRATSRMSATSSTRRSAPARQRARAARSSTSPPARRQASTARRHDRRDPRQARRAPRRSPPRAGRHPRLVGRPRARPSGSSATGRRSTSKRACAARSSSLAVAEPRSRSCA